MTFSDIENRLCEKEFIESVENLSQKLVLSGLGMYAFVSKNGQNNEVKELSSIFDEQAFNNIFQDKKLIYNNAEKIHYLLKQNKYPKISILCFLKTVWLTRSADFRMDKMVGYPVFETKQAAIDYKDYIEKVINGKLQRPVIFWTIVDDYYKILGKNCASKDIDLTTQILNLNAEEDRILKIVVIENCLKFIQLSSEPDLSSQFKKIIDELISDLPVQSIEMSRLIESIGQIENTKTIESLADSLEKIEIKLEDYTNSPTFSWGLLSMYILVLQKGILKRLDYERVENKMLVEKFNRLHVIDGQAMIKGMEVHKVPMSEILQKIGRLIEIIVDSNKLPTVKFSEVLKYLGNEKVSKKKKVSIFMELASSFYIDSKGLPQEGTIDLDYVAQGYIFDLIIKIFINKLKKEDLTLFFSDGYRDLLGSNPYFSHAYANLQEIIIKNFDKFLKLNNKLSNTGINEEVFKEVQFEISQMYDSLITKIEPMLFMLYTKVIGKETRKKNSNGKWAVITDIHKIISELQDHDIIKDSFQIVGFFRLIDSWLYNENDGQRHIVTHGFSLEYYNQLNTLKVARLIFILLGITSILDVLE